MSVEWMVFKGKRILYGDYHGMKSEPETMKLLERQVKLITQSPEPVLLLINLEDAVMTQQSSEYTKNHMALLGSKIKKVSVIGVSGLKTIIVQGISRSFGTIDHKILNTYEEARDWLVA